MKKVLIISSSPRKGNSDAIADSFARGAADGGNQVEKIRLADKKINYCRGCDYCSANSAPCVQKDDADQIIGKMIAADAIVLATPVYFYSMCAQLKTLIDRCTARYSEICNKDFYYILTAADTGKNAFDKTLTAIRGFTLDCLDGANERAIITAGGVWRAGEIKNHPALEKAYNEGRNV